MADLRTIETDGAAAGFWDFTRINPTRSMICFALGAAIGLAIAGFALFTAKGTVTRGVPPETVALVNHRPILRTDFIAQTEAQYSMPFGETSLEQRLVVLDDMVREELFVQRGLELDFPGTDPDTRTALVAAVEQQVVAEITSNQPGEDELRRYFTDHRTRYAGEGVMELHDFVVQPIAGAHDDAIATARLAADALRAGTPASEIMRDHAMREIVPEHASPEQFYFAQKAHLGDTLFAQAVTLDSGTVSDPIALADGIHILQMVKHVRPVPPEFEQARTQVLNDYVTAAKQKLADSDERYLRDKADIDIADDYAAAYAQDRSAAHAGPLPQESSMAPGQP